MRNGLTDIVAFRRRVVGRARRWRRTVWQDDNPRWQGNAIRPLVGHATLHRMLSFDGVLRFEWIARRMLGQPLSLRAWDRMTFNDKVTHRRLRVRSPVLQVFCDKLRMRDYVTDRLGAGS